jgi:hypothetical protein
MSGQDFATADQPRSYPGPEGTSDFWVAGAVSSMPHSGLLSITAKKEEVAEIQGWAHNTRLPVIFFQVLVTDNYLR